MSISRRSASKARPLVYRKFKLPLDHRKLTSPGALPEFTRIVHRAADLAGVRMSEPDSVRQTRLRTVMFYDTDRFDLYRNNFILRKRTFRARDHSTRQELAFKFRHPDRRLAAGVDPRPAVEIPYLIRFKEQVLPAQWGERGTRSLFWHGCKIFERCELENTRYRAAADTFPVLRRLGVDPDARLRMVNGTVVNESLCEIGRLKFAEDLVAKAAISLWRIGPAQRVLTSEFSFQVKYDPRRTHVRRIRNLTQTFYLELQSQLGRWISAGSTKVHRLYLLAQTAEAAGARNDSMTLV